MQNENQTLSDLFIREGSQVFQTVLLVAPYLSLSSSIYHLSHEAAVIMACTLFHNGASSIHIYVWVCIPHSFMQIIIIFLMTGFLSLILIQNVQNQPACLCFRLNE